MALPFFDFPVESPFERSFQFFPARSRPLLRAIDEKLPFPPYNSSLPFFFFFFFFWFFFFFFFFFPTRRSSPCLLCVPPRPMVCGPNQSFPRSLLMDVFLIGCVSLPEPLFFFSTIICSVDPRLPRTYCGVSPLPQIGENFLSPSQTVSGEIFSLLFYEWLLPSPGIGKTLQRTSFFPSRSSSTP